MTYGDTKMGKTYFGGTFPGADRGTMLIIDVDGSLNGLPAKCNPLVQTFTRAEINTIDIHERVPLYDSMMFILDSLIKEPIWDGTKIETLMIDGVTKLSQFLKDECMLSSRIGEKGGQIRNPTYKKATWDEYETLKSRLETIFSAINSLEAHIYVTALARRDKDDLTGQIIGMPDCEGSFRKQVGSCFDAVLFLTTDKGKHVAYTSRVNNMPAGIRGGYHGPGAVTEPTFDKIFNKKNFS